MGQFAEAEIVVIFNDKEQTKEAELDCSSFSFNFNSMLNPTKKIYRASF